MLIFFFSGRNQVDLIFSCDKIITLEDGENQMSHTDLNKILTFPCMTLKQVVTVQTEKQTREIYR